MVETKFKETEVGRVPVDWDVKTIAKISDIVTGATPSTANYTYWNNGHIRWMNSGELNNKFIYDVEGRITQAGYDNTGTHMIPKHCVLIGLAGQGKTRGTAAYNEIELCTNQSIAAILPNEGNFVPLYLYYQVDSQYELLRQLSAGDGGRGGLNKQILLSFSIPLPPLSEQCRIASALSSVDSLISNLDKLIEKKRLIKQGTMQELLTGKKRLPGFTGEWEEKTLGDVCTPYKGKQINKDNLSETNTYPVMNGGVSPSGFHSGYNTEANTIIISEGGNSCGFVNYINTPFWAGGHCYVLDIHNELDKLYLYHLLKFNESNIMSLRTGTGLPNIKKSALCEFKLTLTPLISEQRKIASILSSMDEDIAALEQKRDKYIAIKKGMMQQLLTGKIRLI